MRSLILAGATEHDGFLQHLRLLEGAFKLSAKDLRSQVVREACFTLGYKAIFSYHVFFQSLLGYLFKMLVHPKMKILLLITHPDVPDLRPSFIFGTQIQMFLIKSESY